MKTDGMKDDTKSWISMIVSGLTAIWIFAGVIHFTGPEQPVWWAFPYCISILALTVVGVWLPLCTFLVWLLDVVIPRRRKKL